MKYAFAKDNEPAWSSVALCRRVTSQSTWESWTAPPDAASDRLHRPFFLFIRFRENSSFQADLFFKLTKPRRQRARWDVSSHVRNVSGQTPFDVRPVVELTIKFASLTTMFSVGRRSSSAKRNDEEHRSLAEDNNLHTASHNKPRGRYAHSNPRTEYNWQKRFGASG